MTFSLPRMNMYGKTAGDSLVDGEIIAWLEVLVSLLDSLLLKLVLLSIKFLRVLVLPVSAAHGYRCLVESLLGVSQVLRLNHLRVVCRTHGVVHVATIRVAVIIVRFILCLLNLLFLTLRQDSSPSIDG